MSTSFFDRIKQARDTLRARGERRSGVDRRLRQIPVTIERRIRERRRA